MSVKVGVRVRPFNKRQQQLNCRRCVEMNGTTTHLISQDGDAKSFIYDYSFWSHDKFMVDPDGIFIPVDQKYADQRRVYTQIGSDILLNAWKGYNCCLFAYGQTGSGKSYSMLGYGANKGIIPLVCDQIFLKINKTTDENTNYDVKVSMMEIYNESLRDLLGKNKKSQLRICQHKKLGVYVEGLQKHTVKSFAQIQKKIDEGSNNRSIAATLMNEHSSRSHTIVSIHFIQRFQQTISKTSFKYSTIHLVDLAGSQCVGKTGVDTKDRLRQTGKINQSLSTLGRVIEILAENATKIDKIFVPYRDSKLTFILRNALGGNSCTAMICAISPADDNYQQTLSTLRYAHRAKKIQNKAVVNESDVDKLIRMLRQENQMLKKMLQQAKFTKTVINQELISNVQEINRNMAGFGISTQDDLIIHFQEQQQGSKDTTSQINLSFMSTTIDQKLPYITNISEDQLLSGRLKYSCVNPLIIGNKQAEPKPDITLATLGIEPLHAKIYQQNSHVYLQSLSERAAQYTFINGQNANPENRLELFELDRLIFGTGCIFLVRIYGGKPRKQIKEETIDYTFARAQIQSPKTSQIGEEEEIRKKILSQIQTEYERQKQQNDQLLKQKITEQETIFKVKLQQLEKIKQQENKKLKEELEKQTLQTTKIKDEKSRIELQIVKYRQLEQSLLSTSQENAQLQENRKILEQKLTKMNQLQQQLSTINTKQTQIKKQIQEKEEQVRKQLEVKTIMCNNENILNQYKLQLSKKSKNAQEVKDLLMRKEKSQLQKQLLQLVPMIQKFNLIGRQMGKEVQCGLSIKYRYISQVQTIQVLKTNSYKQKLHIVIHVVNRKEKRNYTWSVQVFRNRFQLAQSMFQLFIHRPDDPQLNVIENDPYWDPPENKVIGNCYFSLQPLFYGLSFIGEVSIVKYGQKIGKIHVQIYPTDPKGQTNFAKIIQAGIQLFNPKQWIQKTMNLIIIFSEIQLYRQYDNLTLEYELLMNGYQREKHKITITEDKSYRKHHVFKDLSEFTIMHYVDKPININVLGKVQYEEDLTIRDDISLTGTEESSVKQFGQFTPSKIQTNDEIVSQIDLAYEKKQKLKKKKKPKQTSPLPNKFALKQQSKNDNCLIF